MTTAAGTVIRTMTPADVPAMIALMNPMYRNKWPSVFYAWQCFNHTVPSVMYGAFAGDELVGTVGVQKRRLTGGIVCGQASWLNVAPGWQRRGIFTQLGREAFAHFAEIDVFCVFANERARVPCERGLGLGSIGEIGLMGLPAGAIRDLQPEPATVETVGMSTTFPVLADPPHAGVTFEADEAFRRWRFAENPVFAYDKVTLPSGEYAIVKTFVDAAANRTLGDIVDLECALDNAAAIGRLLTAAARRLVTVGAETVTIWAVPGGALREAVDRLGFREQQYRTHFGVRLVRPGLERLDNFSRWHLRQADATNY